MRECCGVCGRDGTNARRAAGAAAGCGGRPKTAVFKILNVLTEHETLHELAMLRRHTTQTLLACKLAAALITGNVGQHVQGEMSGLVV